jgi:hypothetical protein
LVVVHRHQDTFCADNQQYIEMLRDVLAASPPVAIFGIQLEMYPGGFPEGSLAYDELSGPPGSGFSWFLDPSPETIPSDLANAFDEIVASAGVAPDPHVLDGPAAPAAGETLPIDPCRGIIRDSNVPEGACLDTHFESSCIGALPPNVASCLTLVSGCIGDVAYVGSYARGCESDAWIDLSCVSASGGYGTSGGLIQANPSYEGAASSMGYLCVCDPSTGQALGARLTVGGMTCEPP